MKEPKFLSLVVVLSFAAGLFGGVAGVKVMNTYVEPNNAGGDAIQQKVYVEESQGIDAISKVSPAVVSIVASKNVPIGYTYSGPFGSFDDPFFRQFFAVPERSSKPAVEQEYRDVSGGTGFIVQDNGLVLTNKHVVSDEEADYRVVLSDGKEYAAEVVSRDPLDDIAVIRIVPGKAIKGELTVAAEVPKDLKFPTVRLGNSSGLKIGQKVLAIGNALGRYENTVTEGIVSAKGREISAFNDGVGSVENLFGLIQTDAAINFGNSGGPLINLNGEVIGMNVAIAESATGIGFAIPVDDLKPILESVEKNGEIVRPVMGVRFIMLDGKQAQEIDKSLTHGAILMGNTLNGESAVIKGGAGEKAGLKEKDVILSVDGIDVTVDKPLQLLIRNYKPGDRVTLKVWREGKEMEVKVTLQSTKELEGEEEN